MACFSQNYKALIVLLVYLTIAGIRYLTCLHSGITGNITLSLFLCFSFILYISVFAFHFLSVVSVSLCPLLSLSVYLYPLIDSLGDCADQKNKLKSIKGSLSNSQSDSHSVVLLQSRKRPPWTWRRKRNPSPWWRTTRARLDGPKTGNGPTWVVIWRLGLTSKCWQCLGSLGCLTLVSFGLLVGLNFV